MVYVPCKAQHDKGAGISLYRSKYSEMRMNPNHRIIKTITLLFNFTFCTELKKQKQKSGGSLYILIIIFLRKQSTFSSLFDAHCKTLIH